MYLDVPINLDRLQQVLLAAELSPLWEDVLSHRKAYILESSLPITLKIYEHSTYAYFCFLFD